MDWRKLVTNAALAGFWTAVGLLTVADEPWSTAALVAAGVAALRAAIGYLADRLGHTVSVDG